MALAGIRATFLTRLERLLASWPQPAAYAAVFGSAGRGTMRPDSDIDLLLVRSDGPDDTWDAQVDDLVSTVSALTGNDLRPLVYTPAELDASRGEPVLLDILESGITVAGERSWFQRQLRPRRPMGTRARSPDVRRGRLAKAEGFLQAAEDVGLLDDKGQLRDPVVTPYVHAGIAASDAICCARLGLHATGDNHAEAVGLLKKAGAASHRHLATLRAEDQSPVQPHPSKRRRRQEGGQGSGSARRGRTR